jgi:hypothetical protein
MVAHAEPNQLHQLPCSTIMWMPSKWAELSVRSVAQRNYREGRGETNHTRVSSSLICVISERVAGTKSAKVQAEEKDTGRNAEFA